MTKEDYIKAFCSTHDCTPEDVAQAFDIVPCNCTYAACRGWLALPKKRLDSPHNTRI